MRLLNYLNFRLDYRKCAALEAGIAATAATTSALASSASQGKSNHAGRTLARWQTNKNLELAHEQMAANRKMFEDSIAEQRLAEERANEWNKASAVAQRFRDAGINPYLAMMEGAAGQMSAQHGISSMPTGSQGTSGSVAVSPSYAPVYDLGAGVARGVQTFFQSLNESSLARKNNADASLAETDLLTRLEENKQRIASMLQDEHLSEWKEKLLRQEFAINDQTINAIKEKRFAEADLLRNQSKQINEDIRFAQIHSDIESALADMNIKVSQAEISRMAFECKRILAETNSIKEATNQMIKNGLVDRWSKRLSINEQKLRQKFLPSILKKESLVPHQYSGFGFSMPWYTSAESYEPYDGDGVHSKRYYK